MQHDYKAALEVFEKRWEGYGVAREAIVSALRVADKLTQEPSDAMVLAAVGHALRISVGGDYTWQHYMRDLWAIMREQLLQEVE